jgi:hypothetical protein
LQRWPGAPLQLPARSGPAGDGARPDQESEALLAEAVCVELRRRSGDAVPGAERLGVDADLWVEPADWQAALDAIRAASVMLHERAKPPRTTGTVRVSVSAVLPPKDIPEHKLTPLLAAPAETSVESPAESTGDTGGWVESQEFHAREAQAG